MKDKKLTKIRKFRSIFVSFLMFSVVFSNIISVFCQTLSVNAIENDTLPTAVDTAEQMEEVTDNTSSDTNSTINDSNSASQTSSVDQNNTTGGEVTKNVCKTSLGALGWVICPIMEKVSEAVDWLYGMIQSLLLINPIKAEDGSPIYEIWKYCLGVANVVFVIFLLIVIYSQITGLGITNYGIKKVLPKLIVTAIMVNLSFLICSLAVDVSNIIGNGLRGMFDAVEQTTMSNMATADATTSAISMTDVYTSMAGGAALAVGGGAIAFEFGAIWMLIPTVLGAIVSVVTGLITIALRQAVVVLLVMIAPLAFVANILPNTEQWFQKWKKMLERMLVFYPMFSLLFGASSLAGFALIASAKGIFWVILGLAIQIFPLFFSWKMMQMSGTVLGDIGAKIRGLTTKPLAVNRAWADSHRQLTRQRRLASGHTPSARLMQFLSIRKIQRDAETAEQAELVKARAMSRRVRSFYDKNGVPNRRGEAEYADQARKMRYQYDVEWHAHNMNKGLGQLEIVKNGKVVGKARKARLERLDIENMNAADALKMEAARGEMIEYDNARTFHNRMEAAISSHFDDLNVGNDKYKRHEMSETERAAARARYTTASTVMEGNLKNIQYAAASAAQGYDTQKKIVETKMQKYFELTPPTKDVEYRLGELTMQKNAQANIDAILPGLRILNQRGDTDIVQRQMDNILNKNIGGGIELGTHASQALASFLMFEVKDSDPFLRRFGKYINLETARAYNANDRKVMNVTYDEYVKGYHDGEPDTAKYPEGRMYAKKGMKQLTEGTSLDNIERTALSNLDESLKRAYGYKKDATAADWDVEGYLKKREEIQTAFEPAFLSASLKWLSGSEQINSGVKFWTGYELKQKKKTVKIDDKDVEQVDVDDKGNPIYEWVPVWKDKGSGFEGYEEEMEKYYRRKTRDYFNDQTTGQILGMRTDYRDPTVEHLVEMYLEDSENGEEGGMSRREYEAARAEIQTRYGDEEASMAEKKRKADLTALKRDLAGRELRKILDKTGKLEQIYVTRRSGAANNAKDWLRKMLNLDDKDEIYRYLDKKDKENKERRNSNNDRSSGDGAPGVGYNDQSFRTGVMAGIDKIFNEAGDSPNPDEEFYSRTVDLIIAKFGKGSKIEKDYKEYKKNNLQASRGELFEKLEKILSDFFADLDE